MAHTSECVIENALIFLAHDHCSFELGGENNENDRGLDDFMQKSENDTGGHVKLYPPKKVHAA